MKLNDLAIENDIVEEGDSLPAKRSWTQESGVYPVTVDLAYLKESQGGSKQLVVHFKEHPFGGFTIRQTFIMTSGRAKGQKNTYTDSDGNERMLPGMQHVNSLFQLTLGKPISDVDFEARTVPLYDYEQRAEVPTEVPVPLDLIGQELQIGVLKVEQNKRAQQNGSWVDTNEKQEINEIDKIFDADGRTLTEKKAGAEPVFVNQWRERNEGRTVQKYKPVAGAATPGAPPAPASGGQTKSLFDS